MKTLIVVLVIVAALLAFTNPDEQDFRDHTERVIANELATSTPNIPGGDILGRVGGMVAGELAADAFTRKNYFLFSIYELDLNARNMAVDKWRFLGIGTQFFELDRPAAR